VASIHWGGNWGYDIPSSHRRFAHALIGEAGVDLIHGHSSHHVKGWELHNDKLILYGCGDLLNDYEGIGGQEEYRSDLSALYIAELDETSEGRLAALTLIPLATRKFSLHRASPAEARWLCDVLNREGRSPGRQFGLTAAGTLTLGKT
jgi:poly-gamma-glutamate synthesis protein (capsule biosynthesis protein)